MAVPGLYQSIPRGAYRLRKHDAVVLLDTEQRPLVPSLRYDEPFVLSAAPQYSPGGKGGRDRMACAVRPLFPVWRC